MDDYENNTEINGAMERKKSWICCLYSMPWYMNYIVGM